MKNRNNLTDERDNAWFVVVTPFQALVRIGHTDASNTYFGSSMALGTVWLQRELPVGTFIADVAGGVFAKLDGEHLPVKMEISGKSLFEKVYLTHEEVWPTEKLERVSTEWKIGKAVEKRFSWEGLLAAGHRPFDNSIDFIVTDDGDLPLAKATQVAP